MQDILAVLRYHSSTAQKSVWHIVNLTKYFASQNQASLMKSCLLQLCNSRALRFICETNTVFYIYIVTVLCIYCSAKIFINCTLRLLLHVCVSCRRSSTVQPLHQCCRWRVAKISTVHAAKPVCAREHLPSTWAEWAEPAPAVPPGWPGWWPRAARRRRRPLTPTAQRSPSGGERIER